MNIAVFQTALLGDTVLTLPLVREIRDRLNPLHLFVVTKPDLAFIFRRENFAVIEDDKHGIHRGLGGFLTMQSLLREKSFDIAILPHRSLRTALLAWAAGIPTRVGFQNSAGWFLLNRKAPFEVGKHDSERNFRLLEALDHKPYPPPATFEVPISSFDKERAAIFWRELNLHPSSQFLIGMAPGASRFTKRWLPERFAAVGRALQAKYPNSRVILFGGPGDRPLCETIAYQMGIRVINLAGRTKLDDLPGLFSDLKLFITNDSGPLHIAYGLHIPTVAVFGPTVREFGFFPKGPRTQMVEVLGMPCRPCSPHGGKKCPEGHFRCMKDIPEDHVLEACQNVVAS